MRLPPLQPHPSRHRSRRPPHLLHRVHGLRHLRQHLHLHLHQRSLQTAV
jgi:hypothetical protein